MPTSTDTSCPLAAVIDFLGYAKRVAARTGATPNQRRHASNIAMRRAQILGSATPIFTPRWPGGGLTA